MVTSLRDLGPWLMQRYPLCFLLRLYHVRFRSEHCLAGPGVRCGLLHIDVIVPVLFAPNAVPSPLGHLRSLSEVTGSSSTVITGLPEPFLGPCTRPFANTTVLITVDLQEPSTCGVPRDGPEAPSCREGDGPKPRCVDRMPLATSADCSRSCLRRPGLP